MSKISKSGQGQYSKYSVPGAVKVIQTVHATAAALLTVFFEIQKRLSDVETGVWRKGTVSGSIKAH